MEHIHINEGLAVLAKFFHLAFFAGGLHIINRKETKRKQDFDFSGDNAIGDNIPHVFF